MPKTSTKTTPSFVCELPLVVGRAQEGVLLSRFEAARQFYNACLGEAMRRVNLIRQSKGFNKARSLKPNNPERNVLFKRAREKYQFSDYAIQSYGTQTRHSWIADHIDAHTGQKLATRAFSAAEKVLFGKAKRVRFKGSNQLDSVESKSNAAGIRWKGDRVEWSELKLAALITSNDPVILHGLNSKVKYVRLVRRKIGRRNKFYAQLVCLGRPFVKPKNRLGQGDVGLDLGPSTIAIVSDSTALLQQFASELVFQDKRIRKLQRKLDRSRRTKEVAQGKLPQGVSEDASSVGGVSPHRHAREATRTSEPPSATLRTNPGNYNSNGTVKKGKQKWNSSKTYIKTRNAKAALERKLAGHRKSLHGELVNNILRTGDTVKLEKLSYKAFQKLYGRSVGKRAPGMFVSYLKSKAENAGGKVVEIPTYSTKLSQTCQCGRVQKKKLSQRVHQCECGVHAQRDLYSAFLAKYIDPDINVLQVNQVISAWESVESRLWAAWRAATINQPAIGGLLPSSFGRCPEIEWVAAVVQTKVPESQDVVDASREPGKGYPARQGRAVGTPLL